jgi:hypothetical protein
VNEILFFGVIFGGIFSLFSSLILLHMGMLIDRFPVENEEERERSIWSPEEFTRYAVAFYWAMYLAGAGMLIPGTRVLTVAGIATLFGLILFMVTALIFSGATYNLMRAKNKGSGSPSAIGAMMKPGNLLRAFHLPVQGRKTHSTRPPQASRPAPVEE